LFEWFRSFNLSSITSGSSVPQLNKKDLSPLALPLPPLAEQRVFSEKLTAIDAERDRVARALDADDELFAALQHRAFRGELGPAELRIDSAAAPAAPSSADGPPQPSPHTHCQGQHIRLLERAREAGGDRERIGGASEEDDHRVPGDRGGHEETIDPVPQLVVNGRGPRAARAPRGLRERGGCSVPYGPVTAAAAAGEVKQFEGADGPPSGLRPVARECDRTIAMEDLGEGGRDVGSFVGDTCGGADGERARLRIPSVGAQRTVPTQLVPR